MWSLKILENKTHAKVGFKKKQLAEFQKDII